MRNNELNGTEQNFDSAIYIDRERGNFHFYSRERSVGA